MEEIEIIEKRGIKEKHFLQEDGSFVAKMYNQDIHFLKNGKYEEIDNTLICKNDYYINKNNNYKISFANVINKNLITIEKDNHFINISLNKKNEFSTEIENTNSKLNSSIKYINILDNIDIKYDLISSKIKESIFINDINSDIDKLVFNINTDLNLRVNQDNTISVVNEDKVIFNFIAPYMIDSKGRINTNVYYNLIKDESNYQLFMSLDKKWLESVAEFPVIIDPTITNYSNESSLVDTFISQNNNTNMGNLDYLKVGVEKVNNSNVVSRALLKFDLPTIGTGSQVIKADLTLYNYPYLTDKVLNEIIDIHRITKSWSENDANWSNMNDQYDSRIDGVLEFNGWYYIDENGSPIIGYETADITSLVQKWYTSTPNYGVLLKLSDEKYNMDIVPKFFSKNNNITNMDPKPILAISYRNQNGLESYMNYEKHNLGRAQIYHNTYNGNMTVIFNIASTISGKMPANLKLVYNTNDVILNKNIGYGIGYKFNLNQKVNEVTIDDKIYIEYEDEDGTLHYFLNQRKTVDKNGNIITNNEENIFYDEDGLDLKIEKFDLKYVLKDKNNNEMTFTKYNGTGYLTEIKDISGSINTIYYDNQYSKISGIKDANNTFIDIIYNTNNTISVISPSETVILSLLDENLLGSIVYKDDTIYIASNDKYLINTLSNISGKKIKYEYYSETPYKLKKVSEYGLNNSLGSYYNTIYGFNTTNIIDNKNKLKSIIYNNYGNPESISYLNSPNDITNAYGMKYKYGETIGDVDLNKNKILDSQIPIKYVKNLLGNSSFENENTDFLTNESGLISLSSEFSNSGVNSLKFETLHNTGSSVYKEINVEKGKYYTFSAYVRTSIPVKLLMYYKNIEGIKIQTSSEAITPGNDFERLDVTIYYPEDASSNLNVAVSLEGIGVCFIDDIQLEEGEVANNYNLIENSDFSNGLNDWNLISGEDYNTNNIFKIVNIENKTALKVNMHTNNGSSFEKTFNIKGKVGDNFTLSFWYKNTGLIGTPLFESGPKNIVCMTFYPTDTQISGDLIENYVLNPNEENWQFFICNFTADYDFDSFKLSFDQYLNGNEFYITNISLFKDVRCVKYNYDENGNLISSKNLNEKTNNFNYDKNNELIKMIDPKGKILYYEYDNIVTNRVLRGISETGISNEIEYDVFGNPIISRIIDRGQMITPKNGLYKIRLKGTNKSLRLVDNNLSLIDDTHGHNKWNIEKVIINEKDYFKIYHNIINNTYLTSSNNNIILSDYIDNNSLFELLKQDNGSYYIKNKQNNKYIKNDNNYLILTDLIENDCNFEFYFESITNGEFIENSAEYTEDGKFITKTIDTNFNETVFDIDNVTGLIKSIKNSKNQTTYYNYNNKNQLQSIINKDKIVNYEYNLNNTLSKIIQGDRIYNFEYDNFLNIKCIKIGDDITLITNTYEENNGNLISTTYGNNQNINYEYDEFNRIKKLIKNDNTYNYKYNNNGDLVKVISNSDIIKYTYDLAKRLYEYKYNNFSVRYNYDSNDNIISRNYKLNNINHVINDTLNSDDSIIKTTIDEDEINYNYDNLGRLISRNINNNYNTNYEYIKNGKRTSTLVKSISNNDDKYSYKYDKLGNITHIYHNNDLENQYYYDDYNELIKEDNYILNRTIKYVYDNLGNMLYKKEFEINTDNQLNQYVYEYNNSNFKDQLTKINNEVIVYDNLGNPIKIGENITLTWINGRQLKKYEDVNNTIEYKYNKDGIRVNKKVNNVETKYFLEGRQIILEVRGDNVLYYIRSNKELIGVKYNDTMYYYVKNNQDDVIGILDSNYNLVAKYEYDSWGNIISILDENNNDVSNNNEHIANINPYRYRSYYYDKETKLYYLNSRYYSPKWCRFINVDNYVSTDTGMLGYNMYLYCNNNCVNYNDNNGYAIFTGLVIGLAIIGAGILVNTISRMGKAKKEIKNVQSKKNIPDRTKEVEKLLRENAQIIKKYTYDGQPITQKLTTFKNKVQTGATMDLKNKPEFQATISYKGIVMEPQDLGNFNYGYIGRAYGFSTDILLLGASYQQIKDHWTNPVTYLNCFTPSICDDPRDTYFIKLGAIKYDQEN